jgi:hypothetical protein
MTSDIDSAAPIFVVGCPRSGTTMLRDLLRSHPRLTFPPESYFIPPFYRAYGDPRNAGEARRLARRILQLRWVRTRGVPLDAESFADCRSFREVVCRLYEAWARQENKLRWGDKTPHYAAEIPLLAKLFPGARILHIRRDGRDVAMSWIRGRFGPCNIYTAARLWMWYVNRARRAGAALPRETYLELSYEELVQQPREVMRRVCDFIGEPFDDAVLRRSGLPRDPLNPFAITHTMGAEIVSANCAKWKTQMPARDRVLFESVAGNLLETLGYETEGRVRSVSFPERAAWRVHQQFFWAAVRLRAMNSRAFSATGPQMAWASLRSLFRNVPR